MRRREFIGGLAGAAAWPLAVRGQQPGTRQITVWMGRANDSEGLRQASAFRQELQAFGWADGGNIRTNYRWMASDSDRVRLAREIVEQRSDVIVVETTPSLVALSHESRTIPIIFVNVSDPIGGGFVANLANPGGNITGFMSNEPTLVNKWVELLKEIAGNVERIGILFNPDTATYAGAFLRQAEAAALSIGVNLLASQIHNDSDIERAIIELASRPGGGLIVLPDASTNIRSHFIIAMAAHYRLPTIYAYRYQATAGGLISYGVDLAHSFRQAAGYVDRVLRGEKPGDLPVQPPTKFDFVVNLNTAKALGLTVPTSTLLRATEVIE